MPAADDADHRLRREGGPRSCPPSSLSRPRVQYRHQRAAAPADRRVEAAHRNALRVTRHPHSGRACRKRASPWPGGPRRTLAALHRCRRWPVTAPVSYCGFTLNRRSVWHGGGTAKQCGSYAFLHTPAPLNRLVCRTPVGWVRPWVDADWMSRSTAASCARWLACYLCHLAVCPDLGSSRGSPTAAPDLSHVCPAPGRLRHRAEAGAEHGMAGALNWCAAP